MSRIGAPFTEKKIETKFAAANAGCRNKMKARQRKISRQQLSSTLRQQENRNSKKNNRRHFEFQCVLYMRINRLAFGRPPPPPPSTIVLIAFSACSIRDLRMVMDLHKSSEVCACWAALILRCSSVGWRNANVD